MWFYRTTNDQWQALWGSGTDTGDFVGPWVYYDGTTMTYIENDTSVTTLTGPGTNTWSFLALTRTGDAGTVAIYTGTGGALTSNSGTAQTIGTHSSLDLFRCAAYVDDVFTGRIAAVKIWTAALTAAEIALEHQFYVPIRLSNLWLWSPFVEQDTTTFRDYSGNGRDWTETGAVTLADGPPIAWRPVAQKRMTYTAPVGGLDIPIAMHHYKQMRA
jgi:hypothetical protein